MGIIDGDGYIEIGPQKQYNKLTKSPVKSTIRARLVLRMHTRDTALLSYLTKVLGVGSLSSLDSISQMRLSGVPPSLCATKKDLITVIVPLIKLYNLEFLTGNRARQYALLIHILENNIVRENVEFTPKGSIPVYSSYDLINLDFFAD